MKIQLYFTVHEMGAKRTVYKRTVEWDAVPRVGDRIEIADGGWSEVVETVWWNLDGSVLIEFPPHTSDGALSKQSRLAWVSQAEVAVLEEEGWTKL